MVSRLGVLARSCEDLVVHDGGGEGIDGIRRGRKADIEQVSRKGSNFQESGKKYGAEWKVWGMHAKLGEIDCSQTLVRFYFGPAGR